MNFNIYLDDKTAQQLQKVTEASNESRNAIIRKAIKFWLDHCDKKSWSDEIMDFQGVDDFPRFEENRDELIAAKDDPFV